MFTFTIENRNGDQLKLTQDEQHYQIIGIEGLNPPNALIRTSTVAGMDGSKFASSKLEERNVVITVKINGDVEQNRLKLYRYFRTKHYCKMYYKNTSRDVYIEGYVETIENDLFQQGQTMQISVICPDPYFNSIDEIVNDISKVLGAFEFPFAFGADGVIDPTDTDPAIEFSTYDDDRMVNIHNGGESVVGLTIEMSAIGDVVNPTIYNVDTRESFGLNLTIMEGDVVRINTNSGQKSVTLTRDGVTTNQINKVLRQSVWLTLAMGDNQFTYTATTGLESLFVVFTHRTRYEAV